MRIDNRVLSFKQFLLEDSGGYFGNTATSGYDPQTFGIGRSLNLPVPTLEIPAKHIEGRIRSIFYTQNPITIALDDGTTWKLTKSQWDYIQSQGKEIREGKRVQIEMNLDGTIKNVTFNQ